ncbi:MAG: hypothetical protein JKY94_01110 [Rhodobacteraceae bacterium]|nr:hypothetical protein [Paracoccaceae bacterium]
MGDRALIQFTDGTKFGPVTYLHSSGYRVAELLKKAAPMMRKGDLDYATARFIGVCHQEIDPPRGLAVWSESEELTDSHGDAGSFVVNISTGKIEAFGGYGLNESKALNLNFSDE